MRVQLKDVASFSKGKQINGDDLVADGKYAFLNGGINPSGKWHEYNVEGNSIAISEGGNSCGYVNYMDEPFWCGAHCYFLYDLKYDAKYIYYALKSQQDSIMQLRSGACMPNIKKNALGEFTFSIEEDSTKQALVVASLDKVSELIALRKVQLAKLDQLVKARFVELFGDPMTNSNGYVLKKYGDLFELNAGGTPSKQKSEYWDNGTISWIGSNMCQNTVIYENDGNYITEEGLKHSSARMFPVDTVLIALVGATIGKTALLKFETTTNQNVLGVRGIRESGYTPEFVFYYTQGLYQKFLDIGDGGFSMASKGFISELPVPVVDLALQEQFAAFVERTDKSKLAIQQSLDKLETLKKSLMQKYFG